MPKLLDYISPAYNWLAAIDPSLPRALFVALVFATVLAWRKFSPGTWKKFSSLLPVTDADTSWFKATLLKLWQALPAAALGAIYGALGTGGNVVASLKLALLGLLAPVVHELAWRYQGRLGDKKAPPSDPDVTVSLMPPPASLRAPDRSRLHNDQPDGAEMRDQSWRHQDWRLAFVGLALVLFPGCSSWKPVARTTNDVARVLCGEFFGQKQGIDFEQAAKKFCETRDDLAPWLEAVLAAKREAAPIAAARHP